MCNYAFPFNYVHMSPAFYKDYKNYSEIMHDANRQYLHIIMQYKGCNFVIPFRSRIKHRHAFIFNKKGKKGLDYSKSIIIDDLNKYTIKSNKNIPQHQHDIIKREQRVIIRKFKKFIDDYCKYTTKNDCNFEKRIGQYSTLKNFHKELGISDTNN